MRKMVCCVSLVLVLIFGISRQSYASLHLSSESENSLTGYLQDTKGDSSLVLFWAADEDGALTIRVQFKNYTLVLVKSDTELHVTSYPSDGLSRSISESEKGLLDKLATDISSRFMNDSPFHIRLVCLLRSLASWPPGMPINVTMDSSTVTVGDETVSREIIDQVRKQALMQNMDLDQEAVYPYTQTEATPFWVSLCSSIGSTAKACYPTSLVPPVIKCEYPLVGGTTCKGRCGIGCGNKVLCGGTRYTQDCLNHDLCVAVYNDLADRRCTFIFPATFDDCALASNCKDIPGTWTLTFDWNCDGSTWSTEWYIYPDKTFLAADAGGLYGKWIKSGSTVLLKYSNGCQPIYTGTLSKGRLNLEGTMKCTIGVGEGCWKATKTDTVLPSKAGTVDGEASWQFMPNSGTP